MESITKKDFSRVKLIEVLLEKLSSENAAPDEPVMTVMKSLSCSSPARKQTVLTGKFGKTIKYQHVGVTMTQKMKAKQKCMNETEKVTKVFCFSIIHQGAIECLSNSSVIEMYETAYHGILNHHSVMKACTKEFGGKMLAPPPQCALNLYEKGIVEAYKFHPNSLCSKLTCSTYWGLMHDGMTTFGMEFNGIFLREVDKGTFLPFSVPYCLARTKGGVKAFDLVGNLFTQIVSFMNIMNNAFEKINHYLPETGIDFRPSPPTYLKLEISKRVSVEDKEIQLSMSKTLPVGNCGDGVSVNIKTGRVVKELYGIESPGFRCVAHDADGYLKRIAKSETMC